MFHRSIRLFHTLLNIYILASSFILTFGFSTGNIDRINNNRFNYPKKFHANDIRRGVLLGTAVPAALAVGALLIEGYARLPQKFVFPSEATPISNIPPNEDILIIFPGAGGPDENIKNLYNRIVYCDQVSGVKRFVCCYDWSAWVGNLFRAAYDSEHVGKVVGNQVAEVINNSAERSTRNVHVIGISVGAFAANAFLSTITAKVSKTKKVYRRLTLLDPFTSKGIFGAAYGPRQFGRDNTDFFEQYLNSDDPVPSTNDPLPNSVTYDVTYAEERKKFVPLPGDSYHSWPVAYLAKEWKSDVTEKGKLREIKHSDHPSVGRGNVIKIE